MKVFDEIDALGSLTGPVHLAIGVFDGVHLGHQAVIHRALDQPGCGVVVTFDQHPRRILHPGKDPLMLMSTRHRIAVLARLGVGHLLVLRFDGDFARTPADAFVRRLEAACRPLGSIAVGRDWRFGHGGRGDVELLRSLGVLVHAVPPVSVNGEVASSTLVREAVMSGELDRAALVLGRPYSVLGTVVHGDHLGRRIGFPTANLTIENEQLPPAGVYAVTALIDGRHSPAVANLGRRPTVESGTPPLRLEVHVLDFDGDLYGRDVEVEFRKFLRPEQRFGTLDELRSHLTGDVSAARAILAGVR